MLMCLRRYIRSICNPEMSGPEVFTGAELGLSYRAESFIDLAESYINIMASAKRESHCGLVCSCYPLANFGDRFLILAHFWAGRHLHLFLSELSAEFWRNLQETWNPRCCSCTLPAADKEQRCSLSRVGGQAVCGMEGASGSMGKSAALLWGVHLQY